MAAMRVAAAASPEHEVCGLLLGTGGEVSRVQPVANVSPDSDTRFELDPAALFAALRTERAGGAQVLGYYHSHPSGLAEPSVTDAAQAEPDGRLWLIVAGDQLTGWRAVPEGQHHGRFDRVELALSSVAT